MRYLHLPRLAAILCFLTCQPVFAEVHWVLGSFEEAGNAFRERERVIATYSLPAAVSQSDYRFRVVVPGSEVTSRAALEDLGFSPWQTSEINLIDPPPAETMPTTEYYRVLASFVDEPSARLLADRLRADDMTSISIRSARVRDLTFFRVLQGPYGEKTTAAAGLDKYGLGESWWLAIGAIQDDQGSGSAATTDEVQSSAATAASNEASEPVAVAEPAMADEPVYSISPPRPGESHLDYCLKRANSMERAIFCQNSLFNRIGLAQMREDNATAENLINCIRTARSNCQN